MPTKKQAVKLNIELDISKLTLGDVEDAMLKDKEDMSFRDQMDLLNKIVVSEGGARAIPVTEVQNVMDLVEVELAALVNPTSDNGTDPESD